MLSISSGVGACASRRAAPSTEQKGRAVMLGHPAVLGMDVRRGLEDEGWIWAEESHLGVAPDNSAFGRSDTMVGVSDW